MGFIDKPHRCNVPLSAHASVAKVGAWFECDRCKGEWTVEARVPSGVEGQYNLTWIRFVGRSHTQSISWQDA